MKTVTAFVLSIFLFCPMVSAQNPVEIWYGNPDGSPIEVPVGQEALIPVYIQTAPDVNLIYGSIMLGTDDSYVTDRILGNPYSPLVDWAGNFYGPFADSPDPGITTEEYTAVDYLYNSPLHFETPTRILEFRVAVSSDEGLIGQTVEALFPGFNPVAVVPEERITFFVEDDVATIHYPVEHFSMITFVGEASVPTLSQWGLILLSLLLTAVLTVNLIRARGRHKTKVALFMIALFAFAIIQLQPNRAFGEQGKNISDPEPLVYCSEFTYVMGDYDGSGTFNVFDMIFSFYRMTNPDIFPEPYLNCECCADGQYLYVTLDVNANCAFNVADVVDMLENLRGGYPEFIEPPCIQ